jgi:hypothetical protein
MLTEDKDMNPSTPKSKWKKNVSAFNGHRDAGEDVNFSHEHVSRPKEKLGKRKFKIQREIDEYLLSTY